MQEEEKGREQGRGEKRGRDVFNNRTGMLVTNALTKGYVTVI